MKRLCIASALVVTLSITPRVGAEPQAAPTGGSLLSEIVAGWLDWILDTLEPDSTTTTTPEPPPPPPPPQGPTGGGSGGSGPDYGGVLYPGG